MSNKCMVIERDLEERSAKPWYIIKVFDNNNPSTILEAMDLCREVKNKPGFERVMLDINPLTVLNLYNMIQKIYK